MTVLAIIGTIILLVIGVVIAAAACFLAAVTAPASQVRVRSSLAFYGVVALVVLGLGAIWS